MAPVAFDVSAVPTAEELATFPPEFQQAATLISYKTVAGFVPGEGAFAQALMDYFATHAEQTVTLVVRSPTATIGTKTAKSVQTTLLPWRNTLITTTSMPLAIGCGLIADGAGTHRAEHGFIVAGWKIFMWGADQAPSDGYGTQPPCQDPGRGDEGEGGGYDDPYEGGCEVCQQWFYVFHDRHVISWWECTPLRSCSDLS